MGTEHLRCAKNPHGQPRWLWHRDGLDFDLTAHLGDTGAAVEELKPVAALLENRQKLDAAVDQAPRVEAAEWSALRLGRPGKVLCLGKNFAAHAREFGAEPPTELVWFAKLPEVLIGPGASVVIPSWLDTRVDPEAEVVLLLGKDLYQADQEQAEEAIVAYTLGNDVTARKQQGLDKDRGWPWLRCKNVATFGPFGPYWVPKWGMPKLDSITLRGLVNGEVRQEASLADLIWSPTRALQEMSRWTPLCAGDIVYLGTPAGVAPIYPGDQLVVEADGLGRLENPVIAG